MKENGNEENMSFAELLESSSETPAKKLFPGDRVSGRVIKISKDNVFVDLGGKTEGIADIQEFHDRDGTLRVKEGDWVEMRISSTRDGIELTRGIKVHGPDALDILREAKENRIPVEGRVHAVKKGGFEIDLSGTRAFCPMSQMDILFFEKPEEHVGKRYSFRIMEVKEKGRNIVVSRKVLLKEEQDKKAKETLQRLSPGLECDGTVTKLADFGAFVDIGGIEGMVHISEISHGKIGHPSEVLKSGQEVKVKVLSIEQEREDRKKIALSIKSLEPDPWEKGLGFEEGEVLPGKVSRLTDFGAFVEVVPGVDGLVHVSEISYDRVPHPSKVLQVGEMVEVLVLGIDQKAHRISLSIKEAALRRRMSEEERESELVRPEVGQVLKGVVEDGKPYGLFVRLPQLGARVRGLLPLEELGDAEKGDVKRRFPKGREIQVEILSIDEQGRIRLSRKVIEEREDRNDYKTFLDKSDQEGKLGTLGDILKDLKVK